jgi:PAS domain S-box-containing protein
MTLLADLPVQRKLRFAMLLTSSVALVVACAIFLTVQYVSSRRQLVQTVATIARITAENSTAAVAFADAAAARQTLEALRSEQQVVSAILYDRDNRLVAAYDAVSGTPVPAALPAWTGVRFEGGVVIAVQPLVEDGRRLGTLYLRATQDQMIARMRTSIGTALAVLLFATALAAVLATVLGRTLARPILELDRTADAVSAGQDYSLRARQYGRDELGRLTGAFNTMLATTEKSVAALRESEQRFRVLADDAPVLIWLADADRQYVWLNARWLEFTGHPLHHEIGEGWKESVHPGDREGVVQHFAAAAAHRREFQMEYRLRRHDGVYRWVLSRGLPRFSATGSFAGFIGSCIDVSDRRLAEQEVAEARDRAVAASKAKDNFLAALSHELRTPLTPVLLLASEEASNPHLPPEVRADFEMIAKNVALEARLIDDLLDLTRITRGKLTLDLRPADVHGVLQDALVTVRDDFAEKKIELQVKLGAPRYQVQGDPVRLQQVFWNVLKNAAKFTPAGGTVVVETSVVDHTRVLVRVTDTGIGLTAAELERIFDAFAQGEHAETSARHKFGGLGLGLAISQRLVQLHGGTLHARSPGRDQGATFEIELPLHPEPMLIAGR